MTIIRRRDGAPAPIGRQEVEEVVRARPALEMANDGHGGLAITVAALGDESPLLLWDDDGEIWTKNPDGAALALMIELAEALGGRVRGDEFETYRTPDDAYLHPEDAAERDRAEAESRLMRARLRRRQWILYGAVIALAIAWMLVRRFASGP